MSNYYSYKRFWSIFKKEFILLMRNPITLIVLVSIPFFQLIIFGSIIKTEVKNIPTALVIQDHSLFTNTLISAFENTGYFNIIKISNEKNTPENLLKKGKVEIVITIPEDFTKNLIRKRHPHILVEGNATNPMVIGPVFNALNLISKEVLNRDLKGVLDYLKSEEPLFYIDKHPLYNPHFLDQYHTLPGLITCILTITLTTLMALSIVTEYVNGSLEILLTTSVKPIEVILGKIFPNLVLGYFILFLTLFVSYWGFKVPFVGSLPLLLFAVFIFILANLIIGVAFSTIAKTEYDALIFLNLYILPALLFSGFLFPFFAMPTWAQYLGNLLPPKHFLELISAIMLRGAGFEDIFMDLLAITLFSLVMLVFCFKYYRKTLD